MLLPAQGGGRRRDWQTQRRRENHREVKPDPDGPCQELSCLWTSFYGSLLFKVLTFACFVPCNQRHPNWLRGKRNMEDKRDSSSAWMRELVSRDPFHIFYSLGLWSGERHTSVPRVLKSFSLTSGEDVPPTEPAWALRTSQQNDMLPLCGNNAKHFKTCRLYTSVGQMFKKYMCKQPKKIMHHLLWKPAAY